MEGGQWFKMEEGQWFKMGEEKGRVTRKTNLSSPPLPGRQHLLISVISTQEVSSF